MLRILAEQKTLALASRQLRRRIQKGKRLRCVLGYQGGSEKHTIWWHADAGVWGTQEKGRNRFWTVFGIRNPAGRKRLSIAVEINTPIRGINRSVAGIFLQEGRGQIYLGHRGNKINRVTKKQFRRHLKNGRYWHWTDVTDGHRESEVIVLRRGLRDPLLLTAIGALAREARRIKELVR